MAKIGIEINGKWMKVVRSPLMWIVWTLQGMSVSFAPLFLYWSGRGRSVPGMDWFIVPLCFAIIFIVGFFYMLLGSAVVRELRKAANP
jgi:hypothetical protein